MFASGISYYNHTAFFWIVVSHFCLLSIFLSKSLILSEIGHYIFIKISEKINTFLPESHCSSLFSKLSYLCFHFKLYQH